MIAERWWFWLGGGAVAGIFGSSLAQVYVLAPSVFGWAALASAAGVMIGARIGIAMWQPLAERAMRQSEEALALLDRVARERTGGAS